MENSSLLFLSSVSYISLYVFLNWSAAAYFVQIDNESSATTQQCQNIMASCTQIRYIEVKVLTFYMNIYIYPFYMDIYIYIYIFFFRLYSFLLFLNLSATVRNLQPNTNSSFFTSQSQKHLSCVRNPKARTPSKTSAHIYKRKYTF